MDPLSEKKRDAATTRISTGVEKLRLDADENTEMLARYEKEIDCQMSRPTKTENRNQLHNILLFLVNAPADIRRSLSRRLQLLARKFLLVVHEVSWRLPRLLVGDVIRFEDALGRRSNLPVAYFKHEAIFKSFLNHTFAGLPGHYQIRRGRYHLNAGGSSGTSRILDDKSWHSTIRSGERVLMSVVSTMPSGIDTQSPQCPMCGWPSSESDLSLGRTVCGQCGSTYSTWKAPSRKHIESSDGDVRPVPMMMQKMAIMRANAASGIFPDEKEGKILDEQAQVDNAPGVQVGSHVNHGISQLKHIYLDPTNDPVEVINSIEDLADQLATSPTSSDSDAIKKDKVFHQLPQALAKLRDETRRHDELTYLDFEREHSQMMGAARCLTTYVQRRLGLRQGDPETSYTGLVHSIQQFNRWVFDHYPTTDMTTSEGEGKKEDAAQQHDQPSSSSPSPPSPPSTLVLVRGLVGSLECYRVPPSLSIRQLKTMISRRSGLPVPQQYLVYKSRKLEDDLTIAHYGIVPQYHVHMLLPIWKRHTFLLLPPPPPPPSSSSSSSPRKRGVRATESSSKRNTPVSSNAKPDDDDDQNPKESEAKSVL